jgi:hypothetical protein
VTLASVATTVTMLAARRRSGPTSPSPPVVVPDARPMPSGDSTGSAPSAPSGARAVDAARPGAARRSGARQETGLVPGAPDSGPARAGDSALARRPPEVAPLDVEGTIARMRALVTDSVDGSTAREALGLWAALEPHRARLDPGQRVAAGYYAAMAWLELDRLDESCAILRTLTPDTAGTYFGRTIGRRLREDCS